MRPGGGKAKGAAFEREVCKRLSLWLTNGTREDTLWRSAMSGGRATVGRSKGKDLNAQAGDISSVHPASSAFCERYYIECKTYRDLQLAGLITGTGTLLKFWRVTQEEAARYNKRPFLIAKQAKYPILCLLEFEDLRSLGVSEYIILASPVRHIYAITFDSLVKDSINE